MLLISNAYNRAHFNVISLILCFIAFFSVPSVTMADERDSLLRELDYAIEKHDEYMNARQMQIDSLMHLVRMAHADEDRYQIFRQLFGKYHSFRMDSALWVATERTKIARRMGNEGSVLNSRLNEADAMIALGMYKESLEILDKMDVAKLDKSSRIYYFHQYHNVYRLLGESAHSVEWKLRYEKLVHNYGDSLLAVCDESSIGYKIILAEKQLYNGNYKEGIDILKKCYEIHVRKGYNLAIPAISLASAYELIGNKAEQEKYLIISAISDIREGTAEYISLWKLAKFLFEQGDLKRANTYIKCSMNDAVMSNARYRMQEISSILPLITQAYSQQQEKWSRVMIVLLVVISLGLILLLGALLYIFRQNRSLSAARATLAETYEQVSTAKDGLEKINYQLNESNKVKEEYIGHVFNLCSLYISKQEELRKLVARKIKAGQIDDLLTVVASSDFVTKEIAEFYKAFDKVFLTLYPNFVDDLNSLLRDDERIFPKNDDLLVPEQRIYALIRLGISDSGKIASFLHYSQQTVYNYRLRVRNKSYLSRDEFSQKVIEIGRDKA